jgi:hypothetical protein
MYIFMYLSIYIGITCKPSKIEINVYFVSIVVL